MDLLHLYQANKKKTFSKKYVNIDSKLYRKVGEETCVMSCGGSGGINMSVRKEALLHTNKFVCRREAGKGNEANPK